MRCVWHAQDRDFGKYAEDAENTGNGDLMRCVEDTGNLFFMRCAEEVENLSFMRCGEDTEVWILRVVVTTIKLWV